MISRLAFSAGLLALPLARAAAQTDYYNTDAGRPLTVEDAAPLERRAVEFQAAPLRVERARGVSRWALEPEVAVGVLPRTQLELGVPIAYVDRGGTSVAGLAGIDLRVLHALNAETTRVPLLAVAGGVLVPTGPLGPDHAYATATALATRTFARVPVRLHLNAQAAFGPGLRANAPASAARPADPLTGPLTGPVGGNTLELSRWLAGAAVDHAFALRALLVGAEAFARAPVTRGAPTEWNAGAGVRWQAGVRWAVDAGAGRHLTGADRGWYATAGGAYAVGLPWRRAAGGRR